MTNKRNSILSALFSLGALFALSACIDPVVIGGNGNGGGGSGAGPGACMTDADCPMGQACVNGMCSASDPTTCNGMPSPLSCLQVGCAAGQMCVMDPNPNACYPSSCGCDAATGMWVCTADCGPGGYCVPQQPCGANGACPPGSMCDAAGQCIPACTPSPEVCNAVDDDCDGVIDEQEDPSISLCANGAVCVMGQCGGSLICMTDADCPPNTLCQNGVCGGAACTTEVCNGLDDDCDGVIDNATPGATLCMNGAVCVNGQCGGNPMQCGPNTPCPPGQMCSAAGVCVTPGGCIPAPETCNGIDDDCDGVVDDAAAGSTLCSNGAICVNGQCGGNPVQCGPNSPCPAGQMCTAMGVCVTPGGCVPTTETCNGIDDDCDGAIDEVTPGATLCPNGGFCAMGQCTIIQCQNNGQCPAGLSCVNGLCQ